MKRAIASLAVIGVFSAGIGVLSSATESPTVGELRPTRIITSSANDESAPLSSLKGRPGKSEAEREREARMGSIGNLPTSERNEYLRENAKRPRRASAVSLRHEPDGSLQQTAAAPGRTMPGPTSSFDGINSTQSNCGCYPPDTNAEAGPNHIVQTVNTAIAVYSKAGVIAPTFPKPTNALWAGFNAGPACRDNNDGDPVVMYDQLADRWIVTQFAIPGYKSGVAGLNYECIAVSTTPDPTGTYFRYQFSYTSGLLNDYPHFGVWPDGYYATYNNFTSPAGNYAGPGFAAYDRTKMLAGLPATAIQINVSSQTEGGALPADLDGTVLPPAGAPNPIVQMQDAALGFPQDQIMIRRFHADFANPANSTLSAPTNIATTAFDSNLCNFASGCIKQKNTAVGLDALSDRIMFRASYRNFGNRDSLLINASVDATGTDVAGVRWAEVAGATGLTPSIRQQSTYSPDATSRWMGSITQDKDANIAIGYSASSTTLFPSLRYAGHAASDALGLMGQGEAVLFAGTGSQTGTGSRWGDYANLTVDPTDDCTFWFASEYYATTGLTNWSTRIGSFRFPSCGAVSQPSITIGDASIVEGNSGTKLLSVPLTLSQASATSVTVNFATSNGTATAGSDYTAKTGTKTFAPGQTVVTTSITINGDTTSEPNETFNINLSNLVGATIADGLGVETITNDDTVSGPTITIGDVSITEGNSGTKLVQLQLTLSAAQAGNVTVNFATANGTATAGSDYTAKTGTKTFAPGQTVVTTSITITGDTTNEANETFFVNLSDAVGATIADAQGVGTITNDD